MSLRFENNVNENWLKLELDSPPLNYRINPSCPDPERREKINPNFYFHIPMWCLKKFYVEAPQRNAEAAGLFKYV